MPDKYIDYVECVEYGQHLVTEARALTGVTKLINMPWLIARMQERIVGVQGELDKAGIKRSVVRDGRGDTSSAAAHGRTTLDRFFHYLHTLPPGTRLDFEAFFPGRTNSGLVRLKPADLVARISAVVRGFSVPSNAALPSAEAWKQELVQARDALDAAVSGKGNMDTRAIVATTELVRARKSFLAFYNGVAKPAVRAALSELGRGHEFRLFFRDLLVHESRLPGDPDDADTLPDEPGNDLPEAPVTPQATA